MAPAWRRHTLKWTAGERWREHLVRLSVRAPGGTPVAAELAYLGPYRPVTKFYRGELVEGSLPSVGLAGERLEAALRVRNAGLRYWAGEDAAPVLAASRLFDGDRELPQPLEARMVPVEGRVERGEEAALVVPVRLPRRPGDYLLKVDLLLAGALWFEEIGGAPIAQASLRVEAADGAEE
jgi:hypothetical protein